MTDKDNEQSKYWSTYQQNDNCPIITYKSRNINNGRLTWLDYLWPLDMKCFILWHPVGLRVSHQVDTKSLGHFNVSSPSLSLLISFHLSTVFPLPKAEKSPAHVLKDVQTGVEKISVEGRLSKSAFYTKLCIHLADKNRWKDKIHARNISERITFENNSSRRRRKGQEWDIDSSLISVRWFYETVFYNTSLQQTNLKCLCVFICGLETNTQHPVPEAPSRQTAHSEKSFKSTVPDC